MYSPLPQPPPPRGAVLRALVCPAIFTAVLIEHAHNPYRLPALLPQLWPVASTLLDKHAIPVSLLASLRLGRLLQRLQTPSDPTSEQHILNEARGLLNRDVGSIDELLGLETHLAELESRVSLPDRVRGTLSIVNLVWLVSIAGLGLTFRPKLELVLGKFFASVTAWFKRYVLPGVVVPHRIGVFEALSYGACTLIVAQAARYLHPFGVGVPGSYVGLTAFVGSMLAFWYSMNLHLGEYISVTDPIKGIGLWEKGLNGLMWKVFQMCAIVPLVVVHQSEFLGFFGALAIRNVLDHALRIVPLDFIGFDTSETSDRVTVTSGILVSIFVVARLLGGTSFEWLKPFHLGVMVIGNTGYFLGLLIRASGYSSSPLPRKDKNFVSQVHLVASLIAAVGLGETFGIVSLSSTGKVFTAMYMVERFILLPWKQWSVVAWFGVFGSLYAAAGYLRTHPELLKSLFDGTGLL